MGAVASAARRGYFSILRWRTDATRDEARNVAVILVDAEGEFSRVKAAPLSRISSRLHDQGILDAMLVELHKRLAQDNRRALAMLKDLHESLQRSLYVTEPKPTAVPDVDAVLNAIYKAYVAPRGGGARVLTKAKVLDSVVDMLRRRGLEVKRGHYLGDFIFDIVIEDVQQPSVMEVLSFATATRNWTPVEHDAGHFLYALQHVNRRGLAIIQPPSAASDPGATPACERVKRWFEDAQVDTFEPEEMEARQLSFTG
jgi:hypothetical protein